LWYTPVLKDTPVDATGRYRFFADGIGVHVCPPVSEKHTM
jgi:hypothetical protein